jgi:hypothetical protein
MNKKGISYLGIIAVLLALIILIMIIVNINSRECNNNKDCPMNAYCNTNYECQQYPDEIVYEKNSFIIAAIILGTALIITAYILRGGKNLFKKEEYY